MQNNPTDNESLLRLVRYFRLGKPRHHVTVHSNGRCLVRASTVKRFRLSSFVSVSVTMGSADALLVFYPDGSGGSKLVHPVRTNGTVCSCFYFYSRHIAVSAASSGGSRFRFSSACGSLQPDGTLHLRLSLVPVRDFHAIMYNR